MSLDISVSKNGEELASMNWLRNPFGLCSWAEDNVGDGKNSLWHVVNDWNYDKAAQIDRKKFKKVVCRYAKKVRALESGHFYFDVWMFARFLGGKVTERNYWEVKPVRHKDNRMGLPIEFCAKYVSLGIDVNLAHYKAWFEQLVQIAELLQDPETEWYCSN